MRVMTFRFEKLYADLVTDDGTVCVAYIAWLDVLGARSSHAGFELYARRASRVVRAKNWTLRADNETSSSSSKFRAVRLSFDRAPRTGRGFLGPSAHPSLRWSVRSARAAADAQWNGDPKRPRLRGIGYADWVELKRPTRSLGLQHLRWGRMHLPDKTVVFNEVRFRSGTASGRASQNGAQAASASGPHRASRAIRAVSWSRQPQKDLCLKSRPLAYSTPAIR